MKSKGARVKKLIVLICVLFLLFGVKKEQAVFALGQFTIYAQDRVYYITSPEIRFSNGEISICDLDGLCERIYLDTLIRPKNAEATFTAKGGNPFSIKREKKGLAIPKESAKTQILRALLMGKTQVQLKTEKMQAQITYDNLCQKTLLRGKYCTYFGNSSEGRKHNIRLCVSALNGCVVKAGESFSFNARVGKRSEENGYKSAKVIQNGTFTEGIGGGVCQVSTTLYNALLKSGLSVTEWHQHSLAVGYVSPSFDAMVSEACDLKFVNDTQSDIYIYAYCDDANLTVRIYGVQNQYEYRLFSSVIKTISPKTIFVLPEDAKDVVEIAPKEGVKSEGYISAYKNGELIFNKKIRTDTYRAIDGVIILKQEKTDGLEQGSN